MSREHTKERRNWPRLPVPIPVFVRGTDDRGHDILEFSSILNISAGGILFASRKPVPERSRILLEIPVVLEGLEAVLRVQRKFQARVLRVSSTGKWYLCAAKFSQPLRSVDH